MDKLFSKQSFNFLAYQGLTFLNCLTVSYIGFMLMAMFTRVDLITLFAGCILLAFYLFIIFPFLNFYTFLTFLIIKWRKKEHILFKPLFTIINAIIFSIFPVLGCSYILDPYHTSSGDEIFLVLFTLPFAIFCIVFFTFIPYIILLIKENFNPKTINAQHYGKNRFTTYMTIFAASVFLTFCFILCTYFGIKQL